MTKDDRLRAQNGSAARAFQILNVSNVNRHSYDVSLYSNVVGASACLQAASWQTGQSSSSKMKRHCYDDSHNSHSKTISRRLTEPYSERAASECIYYPWFWLWKNWLFLIHWTLHFLWKWLLSRKFFQSWTRNKPPKTITNKQKTFFKKTDYQNQTFSLNFFPDMQKTQGNKAHRTKHCNKKIFRTPHFESIKKRSTNEIQKIYVVHNSYGTSLQNPRRICTQIAGNVFERKISIRSKDFINSSLPQTEKNRKKKVFAIFWPSLCSYEKHAFFQQKKRHQKKANKIDVSKWNTGIYDNIADFDYFFQETIFQETIRKQWCPSFRTWKKFGSQTFPESLVTKVDKTPI